MGQVRALKLQLETNYGIKFISKHPIMPWLVEQHTCSTGIPSTQMEIQAIINDGVKNTKHQYVNLVKQFFTCYQQQSRCQRWKQGSTQPFG